MSVPFLLVTVYSLACVSVSFILKVKLARPKSPAAVPLLAMVAFVVLSFVAMSTASVRLFANPSAPVSVRLLIGLYFVCVVAVVNW